MQGILLNASSELFYRSIAWRRECSCGLCWIANAKRVQRHGHVIGQRTLLHLTCLHFHDPTRRAITPATCPKIDCHVWGCQICGCLRCSTRGAIGAQKGGVAHLKASLNLTRGQSTCIGFRQHEPGSCRHRGDSVRACAAAEGVSRVLKASDSCYARYLGPERSAAPLVHAHHVRAGTSFPRVRACIGMVRSPNATLSYEFIPHGNDKTGLSK